MKWILAFALAALVSSVNFPAAGDDLPPLGAKAVVVFPLHGEPRIAAGGSVQLAEWEWGRLSVDGLLVSDSYGGGMDFGVGGSLTLLDLSRYISGGAAYISGIGWCGTLNWGEVKIGGGGLAFVPVAPKPGLRLAAGVSGGLLIYSKTF